MKAISKSLLMLAACLAVVAGVNAQPAKYVEGQHYVTLNEPVRTVDPNKIEVTEVFWYGCQHCYAMEPLLENWVPQLPEDVVFVRSPGMWNSMMETHAQIYYAAESLDVVDKIHPAAFTAIHQRGNYLQTPEQVKELFVAQGVDPAAFDKAWSSFAVTSNVKKAGQRMQDYGVRGVPSLIVNGKYRIGDVATQQEMLEVVNFLIEQERAG